MALNQEEKDQFGRNIVQQLSQTPYACPSLTILSGGTANFLFRGTLSQPLPDGAKTVVVKHSKKFVSANRNFQLDISRCIYEETMLDALNSFRPPPVKNFSIRTPRLYQFDRKTDTQVLEDLTDTIDVKTVLESPEVSNVLSGSISTAMGHAVGAWLWSFHSWVSEPAQSGLEKVMGDNTPMRKIRYAISYGAFLDVVQKFPEIWEAKKKALEEVRDMATEEYAKTPQQNPGKNWGIIHGDFWAGNILMPNIPSLEKKQPEGIDLFVVDWELAQFGRKEYDLGQMIGDLYERKHFFNADSALCIIQGFAAGYGALSDDEAFRIAIHVGQHLICWYIRRDPTAPFTEPLEQIQDAIQIGTDFIVKGWQKDREWFEGSELACLFKGAIPTNLVSR